MTGLTPLQPDDDYCVYCHAPASGRCATCHALVCADCAEIRPGLSRPLAVCRACADARPRPGRRLLLWLVLPALVVAGLVCLLLLVR
jgi:hypothetical protein